MQKLIRWIPAPLAHELAPWALGFYADWISERFATDAFRWNSFQWRGLEFRNPVGIAGGLDKTGESLLDWQRVGAGFLEAGTVTPYPQKPNPGKILDRDFESQSLWNKMGFPNDGARDFMDRVQALSLEVPLFINIGKNRNTSLERASEDYVQCAQILKAKASAFVLNVSSPNTQGLRNLQNQKSLQKIIQSVQEVAPQTPLLLKLSPDMTADELLSCADAALAVGVAGFILTNTTSHRGSLTPHFPPEGGASGRAVKELSKATLKNLTAHLRAQDPQNKNQTLIVSVGGIETRADILERQQLGAHLCQIYSALVFQGPGLFAKLSPRGA
jgi:dihydroorotate dehydrogenase